MLGLRRGASECFYETTSQALFNTEHGARLPAGSGRAEPYLLPIMMICRSQAGHLGAETIEKAAIRITGCGFLAARNRAAGG